MAAARVKRGRPRMKADERKQATILARVGEDLREALDASAKRHGVSLSREVEARLRESLGLPAEIEAVVRAFGGEEAFAVMLSTAHLMSTMAYRGRKTWLDDPYLFDMAVKIATQMLARFRPEGAAKRPKGGMLGQSDLDISDDEQALMLVASLMMQIMSVDADAPRLKTKGVPIFRADALVGRDAVARRLKPLLTRLRAARAGK